MCKASSLVLLTLVLNVPLCSSAPISAKVIQVPGPGPEVPGPGPEVPGPGPEVSGPGPEEAAPVTEDHSHVIEGKEPVHEKLLPAVAGEAAPSPDEAPAEEDILIIAKEPEPIFSDDQVSDDADESASHEPLAEAPQESSEDETVTEEAAFAESSPDETTDGIILAVAVESEQHYVEDGAPESLIVVIPEDNATGETAIDVENVSPEDPVPAAPIPVIPVGASEDEASEEPLLVVPDDTTEVEPLALPIMPEEEESVVLVPAELETDEAGQWEPAAEESAPEEPAVFLSVEPAEQELNREEQEETVSIIYSETQEESAPEEHAVFVPVEPAEQEMEQEETVSIIYSETQEESAPEEHAVFVPVEPAEQEMEQEETVSIISSETQEESAPEEHANKEEEEATPVVLEENALPSMFEEEESVALFPVEPETEKGNQVAAEQTASQESAPEDPVVIVPLDPAEEEPELREQVIDESNPIVSPEAPEQGAVEEYAEEEVAGVPVPIVPEENPATIDEPLPGAPKEEESVVIDTEEEGQGQTAAEETTPALEEPAVVVFVEPTSKEPAPEDLILIIPLEDTEEDDTGDDVVPSDRQDPALEEATAGDSHTYILLTSVTETPSENDTVETALDPGVEVPEAAAEAQDATEILTESPIEAVKALPAPVVSEAKMIPSPRDGGHGKKTNSRHFKAAAVLIKEEPVALVKRGAVLDAAFFTLMSLIIIGFVGMTVSKKLR